MPIPIVYGTTFGTCRVVAEKLSHEMNSSEGSYQEKIQTTVVPLSSIINFDEFFRIQDSPFDEMSTQSSHALSTKSSISEKNCAHESSTCHCAHHESSTCHTNHGSRKDSLSSEFSSEAKESGVVPFRAFFVLPTIDGGPGFHSQALLSYLERLEKSADKAAESIRRNIRQDSDSLDPKIRLSDDVVEPDGPATPDCHNLSKIAIYSEKAQFERRMKPLSHLRYLERRMKPLSHLQYLLFGMGNSRYGSAHFCGFCRRVNRLLFKLGAVPIASHPVNMLNILCFDYRTGTYVIASKAQTLSSKTKTPILMEDGKKAASGDDTQRLESGDTTRVKKLCYVENAAPPSVAVTMGGCRIFRDDCCEYGGTVCVDRTLIKHEDFLVRELQPFEFLVFDSNSIKFAHNQQAVQEEAATHAYLGFLKYGINMESLDSSIMSPDVFCHISCTTTESIDAATSPLESIEPSTTGGLDKNRTFASGFDKVTERKFRSTTGSQTIARGCSPIAAQSTLPSTEAGFSDGLISTRSSIGRSSGTLDTCGVEDHMHGDHCRGADNTITTPDCGGAASHGDYGSGWNVETRCESAFYDDSESPREACYRDNVNSRASSNKSVGKTSNIDSACNHASEGGYHASEGGKQERCNNLDLMTSRLHNLNSRFCSLYLWLETSGEEARDSTNKGTAATQMRILEKEDVTDRTMRLEIIPMNVEKNGTPLEAESPSGFFSDESDSSNIRKDIMLLPENQPKNVDAVLKTLRFTGQEPFPPTVEEFRRMKLESEAKYGRNTSWKPPATGDERISSITGNEETKEHHDPDDCVTESDIVVLELLCKKLGVTKTGEALQKIFSLSEVVKRRLRPYLCPEYTFSEGGSETSGAIESCTLRAVENLNEAELAHCVSVMSRANYLAREKSCGGAASSGTPAAGSPSEASDKFIDHESSESRFDSSRRDESQNDERHLACLQEKQLRMILKKFLGLRRRRRLFENDPFFRWAILLNLDILEPRVYSLVRTRSSNRFGHDITGKNDHIERNCDVSFSTDLAPQHAGHDLTRQQGHDDPNRGNGSSTRRRSSPLLEMIVAGNPHSAGQPKDSVCTLFLQNAPVGTMFWCKFIRSLDGMLFSMAKEEQANRFQLMEKLNLEKSFNLSSCDRINLSDADRKTMEVRPKSPQRDGSMACQQVDMMSSPDRFSYHHRVMSFPDRFSYPHFGYMQQPADELSSPRQDQDMRILARLQKDKIKKPVLVVCTTGSTVSMFLDTVHQIVHNPTESPFSKVMLFLGMRSRADFPFRARFKSLTENLLSQSEHDSRNSRLQIQVCYSRETYWDHHNSEELDYFEENHEETLDYFEEDSLMISSWPQSIDHRFDGFLDDDLQERRQPFSAGKSCRNALFVERFAAFVPPENDVNISTQSSPLIARRSHHGNKRRDQYPVAHHPLMKRHSHRASSHVRNGGPTIHENEEFSNNSFTDCQEASTPQENHHTHHYNANQASAPIESPGPTEELVSGPGTGSDADTPGPTAELQTYIDENNSAGNARAVPNDDVPNDDVSPLHDVSDDLLSDNVQGANNTSLANHNTDIIMAADCGNHQCYSGNHQCYSTCGYNTGYTATETHHSSVSRSLNHDKNDHDNTFKTKKANTEESSNSNLQLNHLQRLLSNDFLTLQTLSKSPELKTLILSEIVNAGGFLFLKEEKVKHILRLIKKASLGILGEVAQPDLADLSMVGIPKLSIIDNFIGNGSNDNICDRVSFHESCDICDRVQRESCDDDNNSFVVSEQSYCGASAQPDSPGGASDQPDSPGGASDQPESPGVASDQPDSPGVASAQPDSPGDPRLEPNSSLWQHHNWEGHDCNPFGKHHGNMARSSETSSDSQHTCADDQTSYPTSQLQRRSTSEHPNHPTPELQHIQDAAHSAQFQASEIDRDERVYNDHCPNDVANDHHTQGSAALVSLDGAKAATEVANLNAAEQDDRAIVVPDGAEQATAASDGTEQATAASDGTEQATVASNVAEQATVASDVAEHEVLPSSGGARIDSTIAPTWTRSNAKDSEASEAGARQLTDSEDSEAVSLARTRQNLTGSESEITRNNNASNNSDRPVNSDHCYVDMAKVRKSRATHEMESQGNSIGIGSSAVSADQFQGSSQLRRSTMRGATIKRATSLGESTRGGARSSTAAMRANNRSSLAATRSPPKVPWQNLNRELTTALRDRDWMEKKRRPCYRILDLLSFTRGEIIKLCRSENDDSSDNLNMPPPLVWVGGMCDREVRRFFLTECALRPDRYFHQDRFLISHPPNSFFDKSLTREW